MKSILGFVRWSYLAPRLAIVAAVVLAVWFGVSPLLHWSLEKAGETAIGAKVDIHRLNASIINSRVSLQQIEVTNPQDTNRNLFEAGEAELIMDRAALLKKKYVVRTGRISGLKFNTIRHTAGDLATGTETSTDVQETDAADRWFDRVTRILHKRHLENDLETVQVSRELMTRWPKEYENLSNRAIRLHEQLSALYEFVENPRINPIAEAGKLKQAMKDGQRLREEILYVKNELKRLQRQLPEDRKRLIEATNHDVDKIHKLTQLKQLDAGELSEYLLGREYGGSAKTAISWLQWGRKYIPVSREAIKANRMRGFDMVFRSQKRSPDFLVENLQLDGETKFDGQRLKFSGTASSIASEPRWLKEPTVLEIKTDGAAKLVIHAQIDRRRKLPTDRIRVQCPTLSQPERILGQAEQLAVRVPPSEIQCNLDVVLIGNVLGGYVQLIEPSVDLEPLVGEKFGGQRVAESLRSSLRQIKELNVVVNLAGTLKQPTWQIESPICSQLASSINNVVQNELLHYRVQLAAQVRQYGSKQLAELQRLVASYEGPILDNLTVDENRVARLATTASHHLGSALRLDSFSSPLRRVSQRLENLPSAPSNPAPSIPAATPDSQSSQPQQLFEDFPFRAKR